MYVYGCSYVCVHVCACTHVYTYVCTCVYIEDSTVGISYVQTAQGFSRGSVPALRTTLPKKRTAEAYFGGGLLLMSKAEYMILTTLRA